MLGSIARSHPDIITKIANAGHEVACHSDVHKWLTDFSPNQFEEDTKRAISSIENVTGKKVKSYRAPAFSITPYNKWAFEILKQSCQSLKTPDKCPVKISLCNMSLFFCCYVVIRLPLTGSGIFSGGVKELETFQLLKAW